jgi:TnsA endonuclease N terminal/TnsA endonuclease C terminal
MAKRSRRITEHAIRKRIKQGRGTGRLSDYKPWLHIQDVPSRGLVARIRGWKTRRVHHLLSILEQLYFYTLEWSPIVSDIREQYPLLPLEETISIARDCGISHPVDRKTRYPTVLTTDFVVTAKDDDQPRTVKYKNDLDTRTLEKLELERRYWDFRTKKLKIVTEENVPAVIAKNVEWFHPYKLRDEFIAFDDLRFSLIASHVLMTLQHNRAPLRDVTVELDDQLGLQLGTSLSFTRYLLANRHLHIDMQQRINPCQPLALVN